MLSIFKPQRRIKARLPAAEIDPTYRRLRWQDFPRDILLPCAAYYLVRKNFAPRCPTRRTGFSRGDLGFAPSGISTLGGFLVLIMGSVSIARIRAFSCRQADSRGLQSCCLFVPWAYIRHRRVMFGTVVPRWPVPWDVASPCVTYDGSLVSCSKRGDCVGSGTARHNVGGGIPPPSFLLGWRGLTTEKRRSGMPAFGAIVVALFAAMMRDTPQSCGLPPIEESIKRLSGRLQRKAEEES